jgi:hypothetical protein
MLYYFHASWTEATATYVYGNYLFTKKPLEGFSGHIRIRRGGGLGWTSFIFGGLRGVDCPFKLEDFNRSISFHIVTKFIFPVLTYFKDFSIISAAKIPAD